MDGTLNLNLTGKIYLACSAILAAIFFSLLLYRIDSPWRFIHDDNGAWFSAIARSHIIRGIAQTRGQDFFLSRTTGELVPYLHHPPLLGLYLAAVFKLTGSATPLAARLAMAAAHTGSFVVFVLILNRLFPSRSGVKLWAMMVFAISPMSVFFGKMPNHDGLALFFLLGGVYAYLRYREESGNKALWLLIGGLFWFLAGFTSWAANFFIFGFSLCPLFSGGRAGTRFGVMTIACSCIVPVLAGLQLLWANSWQPLASQSRSLAHWIKPPPDVNPFSYYFSSLNTAAKHGRRFYGKVPYVLTAIWLLQMAWKKIRRIPLSERETLVLTFGSGAILYSLIFYEAVKVHAYHQLYLLPLVAISSGLIVAEIYSLAATRNRLLAKALIALAAATTLYYSWNMISKIYAEPGLYARRATSSIERQYY